MNIELKKLAWDTDFFKFNCARVQFENEITNTEWQMLKKKFYPYKLITIVNYSSNPSLSRLLGSEPNAFLVDINIQFSKSISSQVKIPKEIRIKNNFSRDARVLKLARFHHSRFLKDSKLAQIGGGEIYENWVKNSFNQEDKYFILYENSESVIEGFLLFNIDLKEKACTIELIAVAESSRKKGIGELLFKSLETELMNSNDINIIKVGTQLDNIPAINFYHTVGCKQVRHDEIYHFWNEQD